MLPLRSKMTPIDTGTSSDDKFTTSCSMLSSKMRKLSRSRDANRSSCWLATSHRVHFSEGVRVICQKAATIEHNFDSPDGVLATCSYENRSPCRACKG